MTGQRTPVRDAQHRPATPGAVLLTAGVLFVLAGSLNTAPLDGEPLLPENWTYGAVVAILLLSIALTAMSVYVVWRYPRARLIQVRAPLPRARPTRSGQQRDWRTIALFLLYFAVITALFTAINRLLGPRELPVDNGAAEPADSAPLPQQDVAPPPAEGPDLTPVLLTGLLLLIILLAAGTVLTMRGRKYIRPEAGYGSTTEPEAKTGTGEAQLAAAAQRGLDTITKPAPDPRAAIIACYAEMEAALSEDDATAPHESDTPSEVLARAVSRGHVRPEPAEALVTLFAEARYSAHTMTKDHQAYASNLLRNLLSDVRRMPFAPSS
ncbi:DUF4129 domain-containing protein [Hoyosella sp. YIM 151337]|uniref:DUF4129 domain-containing protein n=1 Tax=Hoyosella sp. YIM 151337 TaxID=2992742 RepID=UPI0022361364|nr:DUF4129 domain-containing protein [Hoyosella sp. YIM 151337]MCW4354915.1 DUF4129 domain-containing protein [Hoyosella sp. YIM 151337]